MLNAWTLDTDLQAFRAMIAQMRQSQQKPDPASLPYTQEDFQVPVRDAHKTTVRVYKPREIPADGCPGLIVFHGGGFVVGDLETEEPLCSMFTSLGGIAVNVDYRHAPEHVFPTAIHDALDAAKWVREAALMMGA